MANKNKLVVYTAIMGEYDGLIPQPQYKDVDYVCFTDSNLTSNSWKIIVVPKPVENDNTRSARYFKILAHRHLADYEKSIYMDGNFLLLQDPWPLVNKVLHKTSLAYFDHNKVDDARNCAYAEYDAILKIGKVTGKYKDEPESMHRLIEYMRREGFPEDSGLISSGVLIRNHNDREVVALMEDWWQLVKNYSKRDQLSFDFALWRNNFSNFVLLEGDIRRDNSWFYFVGHHRKSYTRKLIKYKFKRWFKALF